MNHLSDFDSDLAVTPLARNYLKEIARWARFLSITGFVLTGFIVLAAIFAGTIFGALATASPELSSIPAAGISFIYLLVAAFYFFPCLFLFQSSQKLSLGLNYQSSDELAAGFEKLKSFFKFVGVLTLVILGFYLLMILFLVLGGGMAFMNANL